MEQNHILFKLDFGEYLPVKKSLQTNWFPFSQSIQPIFANPSAHILDRVVFLCISTSVPNFTSYFGF
jgi:hypothetical protein